MKSAACVGSGLIVALLLAGCSGVSEAPKRDPKPIEATYVVKVPGMTWASCPDTVRRALTHVTWIEQKSIQADRGTTQVTFGVNDKKQFSLDALREALPSKYQKGLAIVQGPQ